MAEPTSTYRLSEHVSDTMTEHPWEPIVGRRAIFTTAAGDRLQGTVQPPTRMSSGYPIVRFANGTWARCDDLIELTD
jgi:hypothetical protein